MPPPEILQQMLEMRQDNPHLAVIKAVRCPFLQGGWAVACTKRIVFDFEENESKTNGLDKGDGDDP